MPRPLPSQHAPATSQPPDYNSQHALRRLPPMAAVRGKAPLILGLVLGWVSLRVFRGVFWPFLGGGPLTALQPILGGVSRPFPGGVQRSSGAILGWVSLTATASILGRGPSLPCPILGGVPRCPGAIFGGGPSPPSPPFLGGGSLSPLPRSHFGGRRRIEVGSLSSPLPPALSPSAAI